MRNEEEREQLDNVRVYTTPPEAGSSKVLKALDDDEMIKILDKLKEKAFRTLHVPQ